MRLVQTLLISILLLTGAAWSAYAQTAVQISPFRFDVSINPGERKVDTVKITNNSPDPQVFQITVDDFYAADEFGKPSFRTPDSNARFSISSWVTPTETEINIPGNSSREVQFMINVPSDAEPGGHYGALFFSPPEQQGGQVAVQGRIGALILVNVSGEVINKTSLETFGIYDKEVDFSSNTKTSPLGFFDHVDIPFALRLHNEGTIHARPQGHIEIYDMSGKQLKNIGIEKVITAEGVLVKQEQVDYIPINSEQGVVLPDSYRTFRNLAWDGFVYERLNPETGKVELIKDRPWNTMGQFRAVLTLQLGDETITREVTFWIIPWQPILLTILGIILLIAALRLGLKHYRKHIEAHLHKSLTSTE